MAIDSSIYSQLKPVDFIGSYEKGLQLHDLREQRQLKQKELKDQAAQKEAYNAGIVTGPDGTITHDANKTATELAKGGYGKEAIELQEKAKQQGIADRKAQIDKIYQEADLIGRTAGSVTDQNSYTAALQSLAQSGVDISQMPKAYDPTLVRTYQMKALTTKEQLQNQIDQENLNIKRREAVAKELEAGAKRSESSAKAGSDLRKERSGLPTTKATGEISAAFNKIQSAAKNPSAAGDLSLIFGYMKMLDPGSTVREGEFANAQNAAGVPTRVANLYNRAMSGERLSEAQRSDFVNQAKGVYQAQLGLQKQVDSDFTRLAQQAGVNPKDVIINFEAAGGDFNNLSNEQLKEMYKAAGGK